MTLTKVMTVNVCVFLSVTLFLNNTKRRAVSVRIKLIFFV